MASEYDRILKKYHIEAADDFDKGDTTDGEDINAKIGRIHDMISEMYKDHLSKKQEAEAAKGAAHEEQARIDEHHSNEAGAEDQEKEADKDDRNA